MKYILFGLFFLSNLGFGADFVWEPYQVQKGDGFDTLVLKMVNSGYTVRSHLSALAIIRSKNPKKLNWDRLDAYEFIYLPQKKEKKFKKNKVIRPGYEVQLDSFFSKLEATEESDFSRVDYLSDLNFQMKASKIIDSYKYSVSIARLKWQNDNNQRVKDRSQSLWSLSVSKKLKHRWMDSIWHLGYGQTPYILAEQGSSLAFQSVGQFFLMAEMDIHFFRDYVFHFTLRPGVQAMSPGQAYNVSIASGWGFSLASELIFNNSWSLDLKALQKFQKTNQSEQESLQIGAGVKLKF